jgi:succinoglycan biosynthesis transport protein ExoP
VVRAKGLDQPPYNMTGETFREQHLVIRTPRDTRVLEAVVTLGDPKLAAEVANAVCLVAIELWGRLAEGDTTASRQNLTSQTTAARERFAAASKRLQDFLLEHKPAVLRADAESYSNNLKQLRTVSLDADAERARLAAAEKELAGQEKFRSSPQVMRADEAGLALRDDATHPFMNPTYELLSREVVQARSRLAGLTRLLDEMAARTRPGRDGLTPVERSAIMESQLTQLQTEVTVARNIVDQIDQMYATAALRNLQSTAQVQIMDSALVPTDPLPRYRLQRIAGAGAAAFALAAIGAIAFQLLRRT